MINTLISIGAFILGFAAGWLIRRKTASDFCQQERQDLNDRLTQSLQNEAAATARREEVEKQIISEHEHIQNVRREMEQNFRILAGTAIQKNSEDFLKLAASKFQDLSLQADQKLDVKKKLIDQNLSEMGKILKDLSDHSVRLDAGLAENRLETEKLRDTTVSLREILSSSQQRGQWGERMVEDILRLLGLIENVNYRRQAALGTGEKPDFTFLLPRDKVLNMDVKFPLTHYERYLAAEDETIRRNEQDQFLKDVRNHIKAVAGRSYIDPTQGTVDYVMVFIPNESIYGYINQADHELIDYALTQKVLLCSPLTLYAVLSLIHQASRNFATEQKAGQVLQLMNAFRQQWRKFSDNMEKMGRRIEDVQKEYYQLSTTRSRMLEKSLLKIDELTQRSDSQDEGKT